MSKIKLKNIAFKKAEEQQNKLYEALDQYDINVIEAMSGELEKLKEEYEYLKLNGNVITDFNKDEYFKKQARLKELPQIIVQLEKDKMKAINDKDSFKNAICLNIYKNIGNDVSEEYNSNLDVLLNIFDEHLTGLISVYREMEQLTSNYKYSVGEVLRTKGVYMSIDHIYKVNQIKNSHNMQGDRLFLTYAE